MGNIYITRDELRNDPYKITLEMCDETHLEILQDITKDMIDNVCGQDFSLTGTALVPVERKHNGNGKDTIFLDKRLVSLNKVRAYESTSNYVEYAASNFVAKAKFISWNTFSDTFINLRVAFQAWIFYSGTANIGIFGTWGWATVPNAIKYLQGKLIKKMLEDGNFMEKYSNTSIGDFSGNLLLHDNEENPFGDYELDAIVKQYRDVVQYGII
jgi:hypothetical protein